MMMRKVTVTLIFCALLVMSCSASSPWKTDYITNSSSIFSIGEYSGNGYVYAGAASDGKIYYNDGTGWSMAYDSAATTVLDIYEWNDGYLYFGTDTAGVIYRTNGGALDTANDTPETGVYCFAPYKTKLYAGTGIAAKIYNTTDGTHWDESADLTDDVVYCLEEYKGYLYAGTGITPGNVYRSLNGTGFNLFHEFTDEDYVYDFEVFEGYLYIATGGSTDDGNIYRTDGTTVSLVYSPAASIFHIYELTQKDGVMYAGTSEGFIYRTTDGENWELDFYTLEGYVYAMGFDDSYIYAGSGSSTGKIFSLYSNQTGTGWGFNYPPHDVRLTFVDELGTGVDGATVTATPTETSLGAWSWLSDMFGFDTDMDVGGTELQGTTGSDGSISFTMVPEIRYTITIEKVSAGIDTEYSLYPKESEYFFRIGNLPVSSDFPMYNLTIEDVNSSYVRMAVDYLDSANRSSAMFFYIQNSTGATIHSESVTLTDGKGYAYYDAANTRGTSYRFGFNVTNEDHGNVTSWQGIDMKGSGALVDFGWPDLWYNIISIGVVFLVAGAIGEADVRVGAIVVPIFAGLFWYIGWLPAAIGAIINVVFFIGAFYYIRAGMKAVDT